MIDDGFLGKSSITSTCLDVAYEIKFFNNNFFSTLRTYQITSNQLLFAYFR